MSDLQIKNINKYTLIKPNWMSDEVDKNNYVDIIKNVTGSIDGKEEKVIDHLIETIHFHEILKEKIQ